MALKVNEPLPEYDDMAERWRLHDDLMGGTRAMREAGDDYLPIEGQGVTDPNTGESRWVGEMYQSWERRVARCTLYNAYKQAIYSLRGRVFSAEVELKGNNADFKGWMDNIDLMGRNLTSFCIDAFTQALVYGKSHMLAEYPKLPEGASMADADAIQARPYLCLIHPRSIIGWRHEVVNGRPRLVQLRIKEQIEEADGDWGTKTVERIRVLTPGRVDYYRQDMSDKDNAWFKTDEGHDVTLKEIPLATCYFDYQSPMVAYPPLEDLAQLNRQHWYSTSLQNTYLAAARQSILFLAGSDGQSSPLQVGTNKIVASSKEHASLQMVETNGKPIEQGWKDLAMLEEQMSKLAMEPLLGQRSGTITATEYAIRSSIGASQLRAWANTFKDALETALLYMQVLNTPSTSLERVVVEVIMNTQANLDAANENGEMKDAARQPEAA